MILRNGVLWLSTLGVSTVSRRWPSEKKEVQGAVGSLLLLLSASCMEPAVIEMAVTNLSFVWFCHPGK